MTKVDPMSSNPPEIIIIGDTAQYLRISQSSLYKLAQEGKVPRQKVGSHWRFHHGALDRWQQRMPKETYLRDISPDQVKP